MIDSGFVTSENKKVDDSIANRFGIISGSGIGGLSTIQKILQFVTQRFKKNISIFYTIIFSKYAKWVYLYWT